MKIFYMEIKYDKKNPTWIDMPTHIREKLIQTISKGEIFYPRKKHSNKQNQILKNNSNEGTETI